ncbi:MAG: NAD(P)-dependent oxidoreductase [Alphaproteobacteria bacterium]|nr:NAD(P)-dependent oxidoreductase [Candidatus Parcubacteria bacterium]NCQ67535.1 NAD(P)-dependent oxidoreductase [Alphaproteobacteria bacterium]
MIQKMTQMQVVILGASGFIGRHLTKYLSEKEFSTICFSRQQVQEQYPSVDYRVVKNYADIEFPPNAIVFHLAETHHIQEVEERGELYTQEISDLARKLLNKKFKRFIYASSTAVYKDNLLVPHKPSSSQVEGKTVYTRSKLIVEKIVLDHGGAIARLTNTFGLGMSQLNLFADILKQLGNETITLREATPIRDYIWIEDLIRGLYRMALSEAVGIYNIASGHSISCEALCDLILKMSKSNPKKIEFLYRDRFSVINVDIEDTKRTFNWKIENTLTQGIEKLLGGQYE